MMRSSVGNGSPEEGDPPPRAKRGRSAKRPEGVPVELTIAGVAWRASGAGHAVVVIARAQGAGGMRSSFATLTVFHGGETFPVTAPVTVTVGEGGGASRQTLRFVFRLPASAPSWRIDKMVLRWRGTEVDLPPPAQGRARGPGAESMLVPPPAERSPAGEPEAVQEPEVIEEPPESAAQDAPTPAATGRYGQDIPHPEQNLDALRQQIISAQLELAHLHAQIAQARLEHADASTAREHAEKERDRAERWLVDVAGELEDVERQLAECRSELDHVSRELATRRAAVEQAPPDAAPPGAGGGERAQAVRDRKPEGDLDAALSDLRSKLEQLLSHPGGTRGPDEPVVQAPVEAPPVEEPLVEEQLVEDAAVESPPLDEAIPEEALLDTAPEELLLDTLIDEKPIGSTDATTVERDQELGQEAPDDSETPSAPPPTAAQEEQPAQRAAASLPGRIDREDRESSWFSSALRRLAEDDREAAGRLLVSVLPAQAIAAPRTFHYDLVVRDDAIYAVDAHPLDTRVERLQEPRPMDETDAWIIGTLTQLGELIVQGKSSFLRVFSRHGLKVKGNRARLDDLLALALAPVRLRDLCAVGALIQPEILLELIASSVDPNWLDSRPISIRFDPRQDGMRLCSFRVQGGSPMVLGAESTAAADFGAMTTIAEGSARSLMRLLAGLPSPESDQAKVRGPAEPLELLQELVRRLELSSL